jgi:sulfur-oxidizing protein SoxA
MGPDTRDMQDDDATNPGMLWVLEGEVLWSRREETAGKSCADCHGDAYASMRGVAARYPGVPSDGGSPVNLEQRINICRAERQNATPFRFESKELLALAAYIGLQSRGIAIDVNVDEHVQPFLQAGRAMFTQRQGQLNLSCTQCHNDNWGQKLAGAPITQAQPTGYPLYRLEWQTLGSLQRRLRNCLSGMRAETYPIGAQQYVELELFLMWRARGMKMETPAVRP